MSPNPKEEVSEFFFGCQFFFPVVINFFQQRKILDLINYGDAVREVLEFQFPCGR
jgi:hypothetical protein